MKLKEHFLPPKASDSGEAIPNDFRKQIELRIHKADPEDQFFSSVIPLLNQESDSSDLNRDFYFWSETCILFCTGMAGLLSAVSANSVLPDLMNMILGIAAAVISFFSTFLIGLRGLRKWQETWLRHRNFLNLCCAEFRRYANYVGQYEAYQMNANMTEEENKMRAEEHEKKKLGKLKESILGLIEQNNARFLENMDQQK